MATIDLLDPAFWSENPHDAWRAMRALPGLFVDEKNDILGVARYSDITEISRRDKEFVNGLGYRPVRAENERSLISLDGLAHSHLRQLMQGHFRRGEVALLMARIASIIRSVIEDVRGRAALDLVSDLATPIAARMTCALLGISEDLWRSVGSWSTALVRGDLRDRDVVVRTEFYDAWQEISGLVEELVGEHMAVHKGSLGAVLLDLHRSRQISTVGMLIDQFALLMDGGAETTRTALVHAIGTFTAFQDDWDRLHRTPGLLPDAVEEVLRWVTPLNQMFRRALMDCEVQGERIRAGQCVALIYPSANRDEREFSEPSRFDIGRTPNHHLSFGYGTHFCLGARLGRAVLQETLRQLVAAVERWEWRDDPRVEPCIFARLVTQHVVGVVWREH